MFVSLITSLLACAPTTTAQAEMPSPFSPPNQPEELGLVRWNRGYEAAKQLAAQQGKPLLVLFDEVPGCQTVLNYGRTTLSDPLVIDAAESLFVPVVVYNNVEGPDRKVLKSFGEPAWNNPVVRIVTAAGSELAPRLTGDWSRGALLRRMVTGLQAADEPVPDWLRLVAQEDATSKTATYAMGCFWSGEAHLGAHPGVRTTRTGWRGGREVVELTYDPKAVSKDQLDVFASQGRARPAPSGTFRPTPGDDRHTLRSTTWAAVPMTAAQATKVNAAVDAGRDPARWLSPRQLEIHAAAVALGGGWNAGLGQIPLNEGYKRALAAIARRQ